MNPKIHYFRMCSLSEQVKPLIIQEEKRFCIFITENVFVLLKFFSYNYIITKEQITYE
jgi:hypothetical protein